MNTTPSIWNGVPSIACRPRGNTHSAPIVSNGDGPVKDLRSSVCSGSAQTDRARPALAVSRHAPRRFPRGQILASRMITVSNSRNGGGELIRCDVTLVTGDLFRKHRAGPGVL